MADNFLTTVGDGTGPSFASDDISSVQYPRGKVSLGADGSATDAVGGTGVDGAGVQRVSLATDVPLPAGTNNIGDVDVLSQIPGTGATNLGKAQDSAVGATDTGVAMLAQRDDEQSAVTPADGDYVVPRCDKFGNLKVTNKPDATSEPKYGVINVSSSGDNTLQAAAGAGIKIRVLAVMLVATDAVNVRFESGAGGTALTGVMPLIASSGFTLPYNPDGWFETGDNALLNLELSAAESVDGCFTYVEV